jgi:hypothetical protein
MIILLHIVIAISSMVYSTLLFRFPSKRNFNISYGLIGATLASGTYLAISLHSSLVSSCVTGVIYLSVVSAGVGFARFGLAEKVKAHIRTK